MITRKRLRKLLESAEYQFAKTMPKTPHWYTLKQTWKKEEEFLQAVLGVRHYGKAEDWYSRTFTYFYAGEYKYWTMGNDVSETILINKARIKDDNADWIP
jgi:hypothetical protein